MGAEQVNDFDELSLWVSDAGDPGEPLRNDIFLNCVFIFILEPPSFIGFDDLLLLG